jgi:uncharacterized repeat protein (TIGR03847 family)
LRISFPRGADGLDLGGCEDRAVLIELDPVERITTEAIGPPGERVFYLQGRKEGRLVTLLVEKQQLELLVASVVEILARIGKETEEGPSEEAMALEEPVVPEWRAGRLSIGYEEQRDLLLLEAEEQVPEEEDDREPQRVRFWAARDQMLALARHGAAVCARGRPRCELCGNPIDPEGHVCPALNGHQKMGGE